MYITWDEALGHYRVWGFEMTLRDPPDEVQRSFREARNAW